MSSDEFEAKAREIVKTIWDNEMNKEQSTRLVAQALRDAQPVCPSDDEIESAAMKWFGDQFAHDESCAWEFRDGAKWAIERMKK